MAVRARILAAALTAAASTGRASRVGGHGTLSLGELEPNCPGQTVSVQGLPLEQAVLASTDKKLPLDNAHSGPESVDDMLQATRTSRTRRPRGEQGALLHLRERAVRRRGRGGLAGADAESTV
jgi:hypothetical protein